MKEKRSKSNWVCVCLCCNLDDPFTRGGESIKSLSKLPLGVISNKHGRCVGRCVLHYQHITVLVGSREKKSEAWWCGWLSRSRGWTRWTRSIHSSVFINWKYNPDTKHSFSCLQTHREKRLEQNSCWLYSCVCLANGGGCFGELFFSFHKTSRHLGLPPPSHSFLYVFCVVKKIKTAAAVCEGVKLKQWLTSFAHFLCTIIECCPSPAPPFNVDQICNILYPGCIGECQLSRRLALSWG